MPASKAQRTKTAVRRAKAVEMRTRGSSWQEIADDLGYVNRSAACADVTRALEAAVVEQNRNIDLMRQEELRAYDQLLVEAWAVLEREHVTVSHGRIIRDEETGEKLLDDGPVLQAIDRVVRIRERRAKLLGLDAPQRHEVVSLDAVDAEIRRLTAELGGSAEAGEATAAEATARAEG